MLNLATISETSLGLAIFGVVLLVFSFWLRLRQKLQTDRQKRLQLVGRAEALRRQKRFDEARDLLLEAERHGKEMAAVHYQLACCFSRLGQLEKAHQRLIRACQMDSTWFAPARFDPDLKPLMEGHTRLGALWRQHGAGQPVFNRSE